MNQLTKKLDIVFVTNKDKNKKNIPDEVVIKKNVEIIQNNKTATPEEKAFLISYINRGYVGYNAVPDIERKIALQKKHIELKKSEPYMLTEMAVKNVAGPALTQENADLKQA